MAWTITEIHSGEAINDPAAPGDPILFDTWGGAVDWAGLWLPADDAGEYTIVEVS